jgi:hypothetical protein
VYRKLCKKVNFEAQRTQRSVVNWEERFGPNLASLVNAMGSEDSISAHSFVVCGVAVDARLFANITGSFLLLLTIAGFVAGTYEVVMGTGMPEEEL